MGIRIGFAGSVAGMTAEQRAAFADYIGGVSVVEFRVGGLIGADEQATEIICRTTAASVVVCPPGTNGASSLVRAVARSIVPVPAVRADAARSVTLVDGSDLIVLAPRSRTDTHGGTVRTFRYARWRRLPIVIVWPDGAVEARAPARAAASR